MQLWYVELGPVFIGTKVFGFSPEGYGEKR